ncbi:MAG: aldolase/citrate lyase family protein [Acidobacteriota bacterium]
MRAPVLMTVAGVVLAGSLAVGQAPGRYNPMITLLEQGQPVFGLYAPSNRRFPGQPDAAPKPVDELAREALSRRDSDYIFDGSMEGDFERGFASFSDFMLGLSKAGLVARAPHLRVTHPVIVKMHEIAPDPAKAVANIGRQLNLGVHGIMFVSAESADEVRTGIAAMRFKARGGTRADDVGGAPAAWGMSEAEYRRRADVWPLNPAGELVNWTIIESKEGLARVREIAAVPGIGVLWPGAGTLRQVFSTTGHDGKRVLDEPAWEAAIQQVLSACKEFKVACGYPASAADIELRMKQGFSVFVMGWGEPGFKAIDIGRKAAGRTSH